MGAVTLLTMVLTAAGTGDQAATPAAVDRGTPVVGSWEDLEKRFTLECRAPFGLEVEPVVRKFGRVTVTIQGSRAALQGRNQKVTVGVLSALKDVTPATRKNVARAVAAFRKARVDLVLANGDVALNEFDLEEAMEILGQTGYPTFVLIGNSEGRGAFNRAFLTAEQRHPNLFNLNWVRHVDLGSVHLVSLPGYYNAEFVRNSAGCSYGATEIEAVGNRIDAIQTDRKIAVLVAHGPPRSRGEQAIDRAHEWGNVGDPAMADLIEQHDVRYGLFGHILEAGGRAAIDVRLGKEARPGKRYRRLYLNAGTASAMPWQMLNGKTSHGMAAIVTISPRGGPPTR